MGGLVSSGKGIAHEIGREAGDVVNPSVDDGGALDGFRVDVLGASGLSLQGGLAFYHHFCQFIALGQAEVTLVNGTQPDMLHLQHGALVAHERGLHTIRTSGLKALQTIHSVGIGHAHIACARRGVDGSNHRTGQRSLAVGGYTADT